MNSDIRIVIADDNLFFAEALAENLNMKEGYSVKAVLSDLNELEVFCNSNSIDILILDVNFNGTSSFDHLSEIRKDISAFKIIMLTSLNDAFNRSLAEQHKVESFLSKESSFKGFHDIISDCYYSTTSNKISVGKGSRKLSVEINGVKFTENKINILKSLYQFSGETEGEIATHLNISVSSLKTHKRQLYEMTNTKRIPDLLKFGFENGILLQ